MKIDNTEDARYLAKGHVVRRIWSSLLLLPAWFAPHKSLRVFFHRMRGVDVGRNVEIGYFCILGNVHPQMVHIADRAVVAAKTVVLEHDNSYFYSRGGDVLFGDVTIGRRAFIGIGALVMPGICIGEGAIVGAMSLVKNDIPPGAVAVGIPARILGHRSSTTETSVFPQELRGVK